MDRAEGQGGEEEEEEEGETDEFIAKMHGRCGSWLLVLSSWPVFWLKNGAFPSMFFGMERPRDEGAGSWNDLQVWRYSHMLVLKVYSLTNGFPSNERFRLVDQLCRAASSVSTNIAEGKGRLSIPDFVRFLSIARGSVEEVKVLLLLARDLRLISDHGYRKTVEDYHRVGRMLNGLIKSLRETSKARQH